MANFDVLKKYQIDITADTTEFLKELSKLEKEASNKLKDIGLTDGLRGDIEKLQAEVKEMRSTLTNAVNDINSNINNIHTKKIENEFKETANNVSMQVDKIGGSTKRLGDTIKNIANNSELSLISNEFKNMQSSIEASISSLTSSLSELSGSFAKLQDDIRSGAINPNNFKGNQVFEETVSAAKKSSKSVKKSTEESNKALQIQVQKTKEAAQAIEYVYDEIQDTINGNINKSNTSNLIDNIAMLELLINEYKTLSKMGKEGKLETGKIDLVTDIDTLKLYLSTLKNILNSFTDVGKGNKEIRLKIDLENQSNLVDKINEIIHKVQGKVNSIKIPVGYTYDVSDIKDKKDLDDINKKSTEDVLYNKIKIDVEADTSTIVDNVNKEILRVNKEILDSGKKIEVEVIGKVNNNTIEDSAKKIAYEIEDAQYNIAGSKLSFDSSSGIATENTLSEIKNILSQWNATGIPGTQSQEFKEQLKTKEANAIASSDFDKLFRTRRRSDLAKKIIDQNNTTDSLIAQLLLKDEAKEELRKLKRSTVFKKGGEEGRAVLHASKYYTGSFNVDGVEYARYGSGKQTLADWQKELDTLFDKSFIADTEESLFNISKTVDVLDKDGKQIKDAAGTVLTETVKIKGALTQRSEALDKQKKAIRESLLLNNVQFKKDEYGKYTNEFVYEKGTITSNEDAYAKIRNLSDQIKDNAREEYALQMDKKRDLIDQRNVMQEILELEKKSQLYGLNENDNDKLNLLKQIISEKAVQISDRDKYDELNLEKQSLIEKRLNEGLTQKEYLRIQEIDGEIEGLFVKVENLSEYISTRTAINLETGLSNIDQEINDINEHSREIIKKAHRDMSHVYSQFYDDKDITQDVKSQAHYDYNQKKIEELQKRNSHLERLIQQKPGKFGKTSLDYSAMTNAEKAEYFSNQKHIKALRTKNLLYAEQNNLAAELLGTTEKINAEEKVSISTLHIKKSEKEGYEKLFGKRINSTANSDEEFIRSLSDEELTEALSSIDKVVTAIDNRTKLSNEEIKALVQHRIKEDVEFLRESLKKEEQELLDMEKNGASQKAIDNKQYRIKRITSSIAQLENPNSVSDNSKLLEERENLNKINSEEKELVEVLKTKLGLNEEEIQDIVKLYELEKKRNEESSKLREKNIEAWSLYVPNPKKPDSKLGQADSIGWDKYLNSWELEEFNQETKEQLQAFNTARHAYDEHFSALQVLNPELLALAESDNKIVRELLDTIFDLEDRKNQSTDAIFDIKTRLLGYGNTLSKNPITRENARKHYRDAIGGKAFNPLDTSDDPENLYKQRTDMYTDYFKNQDNASIDTARKWLKLAKEENAEREKAKQKTIEIHETEKKIVEERQKELSLSQKKQQESINSEYDANISKSQDNIDLEAENIVKLQQETNVLKERLEKTSKKSEYEFVNLAKQESDIYTNRKNRLDDISKLEEKLKTKKLENVKIKRNDGETDESYNKRQKQFEEKHKNVILSIEEDIKRSKKENVNLTKQEEKSLKEIAKQRKSLSTKYKVNKESSSDDLLINSNLAFENLNIAKSRYSNAKNSYGIDDDRVKEFGKELVEARDKYVSETLKYIANTSVDKLDKAVFDEFEKQSKEKLDDQTSSLREQIALKEEDIKTSKIKKSAAESELAIQKKKKKEAENELAINKEIKKFQTGMSANQKKASLGVDYELMNIQKMEEELETLPKTSEQYQELSNKIKIAKNELVLFRQEAEELGLTLSETTGRMYLDEKYKDTKIEGVSYTGLFKEKEHTKLTSPNYDEMISDAKKHNAEQLKSYHYHSAIVDEIKEEANEQARLTKMWNIAGMSDREAEITIEIAKVNTQLKNKTNLTEEQTEALKEQLAVLHKTIETEKLDIQLGKGGYVQRKVSRYAFVANPEQYATNKYLKQMLSSPTGSYSQNNNKIENYRLATESTLQNIQKILLSGVKVKVIDSKKDFNYKGLHSLPNIDLDKDKQTYEKKSFVHDATKYYGYESMSEDQKKIANKFAELKNNLYKNGQKNKEVEKELNELISFIKSDKSGLKLSRKNKSVWYDDKNKSKSKETKEIKNQTKAIDENTSATKKNNKEKSKVSYGKFGEGTRDINRQLGTARRLLGRNDLSDASRKKWEDIKKAAEQEANIRGYQKNDKQFYVDPKKVSKKSNEQEKKEIKKQIKVAEQQTKELIQQKEELEKALQDRMSIMDKYGLSGLKEKTIKDLTPNLSDIKEKFNAANAELISKGFDPLSPEDILGDRKTLLAAWNKIKEEIEKPITPTIDTKSSLEKAESELKSYIKSNKVNDIKNNPGELINKYDAYINAGGTQEGWEEIAKSKSSLILFLKDIKLKANDASSALENTAGKAKEVDSSTSKKTTISKNQRDAILNKFKTTASNSNFIYDEDSLDVDRYGVIIFTKTIEELGDKAEKTKYKVSNLNDILDETGSINIDKLNKSNFYFNDKNLSVEKVNKFKSELNKLVNSGYAERLSSILPSLYDSATEKRIEEAQKDLADLIALFKKLRNGENIDVSQIEEFSNKLKNVKNSKSIFNKELAVGDSLDLGRINNDQAKNLQKTLIDLAVSAHDSKIKVKEFGKENMSMTYTVVDSNKMLNKYIVSIDEAGNAITKLVKSEKNLNMVQKAFSSVGKKFGEILNYTIASVSIYEIFNFFKRGISVVQEFDAAMVEIKKVSKDTEQALKSFGKEAYNIASEIGSTGVEIINSAADWEKLGYAIEDASELAKNSALYSNVGDMEIDVATEHMISTLKAFNIEAKDSIAIVDKFNHIGNNYAITSEGIGAALERSAASLKAAGNDIDESIALVTAGNIISQDPESVGNAIKVLSLRIRGSKTELEEMGEETDNLASSTSKLRSEIQSLTGVDIMLDENTYKSTYQIMLEISKIWDKLDDVSQANILEKLAGKTRASVVAGLLQQGETLENVYKDSLDAEGSALKENEEYLKSIQGHIDKLTNAWQAMWSNSINRDFINFFIDASTEIIKFVDKIGAVKVAIGGLFGLFALKNNSGGRAKYICKSCHFAYRNCCHKKVNYPPSLIN